MNDQPIHKQPGPSQPGKDERASSLGRDGGEPPSAEPTDVHATEVYVVAGADPEVLAYAMAKYSRSSLSLKEALGEISSQRAEQFLNTFYFQYGHRSIADLAHLPMAVERLSLLAAIALVDEPRWDGQERSTRYQDFRTSGWFTPELGELTGYFQEQMAALFGAYDRLSSGMLDALTGQIARPAEMAPEAYKRTLKARAFDVARYLLPLATHTSLGQIVNARTLEMQVSRLLSSRFAEIRTLGEKLRLAAAGPAWNMQVKQARTILDQMDASDGVTHAELRQLLLRPVPAAPTLVKYAVANEYARATRVVLEQAAAEVMGDAAIEPAPVVDLLDGPEPLDIELATSLLYTHCHFSYRQIRQVVQSLDASRRAEIIALGTRHRNAHDELRREFHAGHALRFDILMDIGGFRDMHRHRRCTQLLQGFTDRHGFETPETPGQPTLAEAGLDGLYTQAMAQALAAYRTVRDSGEVEAAEDAQYCLPLGTRVRAMFKMDFAEAQYIAELRSGASGHFSYRRVAWSMFTAVRDQYPGLAGLFRIEDVYKPVNLLQR